MKENYKQNNFNLIRLIAALQVAIDHIMFYLKIDQKWIIFDIVKLFPGVPIFFFVSGYLISKSYEKNPIKREYFQNRVLRIYPALIVCTLLTFISVYLTGFFSNLNISNLKVMMWFFGQMSILQIYSPKFMSSFGTGNLNGSLWTIAVELQFYLLVPIFYWIMGHYPRQKKINYFLSIAIAVFMIVNIAHFVLLNKYRSFLWDVSFTPWFYMFLVGVIFQKNFDSLIQVLRGKVVYVFILYLSTAYMSKYFFGWSVDNNINPILYTLLAILIFTFAYSFPDVGNKFLQRNDFSYGVYIYHIPILNLFIYYGFTGNLLIGFITLLITIIIAIFSWLTIEKPAIRLKKNPFNPILPIN
jgi:peptidoglycan/LPS O-acetylase OafA/YrhL